jgi:hypothetical protein
VRTKDCCKKYVLSKIVREGLTNRIKLDKGIENFKTVKKKPFSALTK